VVPWVVHKMLLSWVECKWEHLAWRSLAEEHHMRPLERCPGKSAWEDCKQVVVVGCMLASELLVARKLELLAKFLRMAVGRCGLEDVRHR
jgi:hypothetical protein